MDANNLFSVKNKVVVATGGAGHLVSPMLECLCSSGASCVSLDMRPDKLDEQRDLFISKGFSLSTHSLDVRSQVEWEDVLSRVLSEFGHVDVLINGAGINQAADFLDVNPSGFREVVEVNLTGTLLGCQVFGRQMVAQGSGSIINISSTSSDPPLSRAFAYSASKAGVTNLTKNVAREFARFGVRVNAIRPGFFPTEWNKRNFLTTERIDKILGHTPMGRFGDPSELAGIVQWLCSSSSSFATGAEFVIDGGFSCQTI